MCVIEYHLHIKKTTRDETFCISKYIRQLELLVVCIYLYYFINYGHNK